MPTEPEGQELRFPTRAEYTETTVSEFAKALFDEGHEEIDTRSAFPIVAALKLPKIPLGR